MKVIKKEQEANYRITPIGTIEGKEYYEVHGKKGRVFLAKRNKKGNLKILKKYNADSLQLSEPDKKGKVTLLLVKVIVKKKTF